MEGKEIDNKEDTDHSSTNASINMPSNESNAIQRIPYPKQVIYIIISRLCEQFNFWGMKAVLLFYLNMKLKYSEDDAILLFHGIMMFMFFVCILGGIIADVWLGNFKTIVLLSTICLIGNIIITTSSIPTMNLPPRMSLIIGLILVSIGSGGIKPCVTTFAADQFRMPEQSARLVTYFSMLYFLVSLVIVVAMTLTPILRADVQCFGDDDCYSLAFGVPAVFMFLSIVFFFIGKSSYTYVAMPSENMIALVTKCITNAITTRIRDGRSIEHRSLLDYSIDKYGEELVNKTRQILRLMLLFSPLPLFAALSEQQGSRWTFQANRMNGDIGFMTIHPDQMQMLNSFLILILIPSFETVFYPLLSKIGIRRPLQKMSMGGILTACSFFISALVEFKIEASPEKTVSMLWLIPQYFVSTISEIMFSITGFAFSYEQAPENMKSVVQAFLLLTFAFGNFIVLFTVKITFFDSLAKEFLLFSAVMFAGVLVFIVLAYNFKSQIPTEQESDDRLPILSNSIAEEE